MNRKIVPRPSGRTESIAPTRHRMKRFGYILVLAALLLLGVSRSLGGEAEAATPYIRLRAANICLDTQDGSVSAGAIIQTRPCRSNQAQVYTIAPTTVRYSANLCMAVKGNSKSDAAPIVTAKCAEEPGQVWLWTDGHLYNPNSQQCAAIHGMTLSAPLELAQCAKSNTQLWAPQKQPNTATCRFGDREQQVTCAAVHEWQQWYDPKVSHVDLLTTYTNGASYEAWCADFVSYVYREAGHPFTDGTSDGWDENTAANIQSHGFIRHNVGDGYIPRAGDVAYFSYPGGHVELVISGGKHPTFLYGNSGRIDSSTGNGQMEANTITADGSRGALSYYLSPR